MRVAIVTHARYHMEPKKKESVDAIKSFIDVIQAAFTAAWKAILLLGSLILVAYCYFESIVPEGLSLGDAFFLASAAFSFTCIALIGIGFGAFSAVWALKLVVGANNFRLKRRGEPPAATLHRAVDNVSMLFMSLLVALPSPTCWFLSGIRRPTRACTRR